MTRKVQAADMSQFGTIDIVEIELPNPDDNVIKTIAQLDEYAGVVLNQIEGLKQIYPSICKVHLVASIPSCLSIELGKKFCVEHTPIAADYFLSFCKLRNTKISIWCNCIGWGIRNGKTY